MPTNVVCVLIIVVEGQTDSTLSSPRAVVVKRDPELLPREAGNEEMTDPDPVPTIPSGTSADVGVLSGLDLPVFPRIPMMRQISRQ